MILNTEITRVIKNIKVSIVFLSILSVYMFIFTYMFLNLIKEFIIYEYLN